jgi:hypothetical protein
MTPRPYTEVCDTVFAKTPLGRVEIGQRSAGLGARQRSILIMLDGQKPLRGIDTLLPPQQLAEIVDFLLAAGLVEAQALVVEAQAVVAPLAPAPVPVQPAPAALSTPPAPTPYPSAPPLASALPDASKLQHIKTLMTETAMSYLGLMAADIVRRVEGASNETQLMSVLGQWHMAMRDSKYGKDVAGAYLDEIKARFAAPQAPARDKQPVSAAA